MLTLTHISRLLGVIIDGAIMETKTRSNAVVTVEATDTAITFHVKGAGSTTLRLDAISAPVRAQALIHGLTQRVSDRAAISRNPENGQPATPEDKLARMAALVEHYNGGSAEWSPGRAGAGNGGGRARTTNPVIEAVAAIQGLSYADMDARIKLVCEQKGYKPRAYLAKLATQPAVLAKMAELAGAADDASDADDVLGELQAG